MNTRLELHELLCEVLGSRNVYFQAPDSQKMKYPAIRYTRDDILTEQANNNPYIQSTAYQLIVIDEDPDSEVVERVKQLPKCRFERHYAADNLNHDVFILYY